MSQLIVLIRHAGRIAAALAVLVVCACSREVGLAYVPTATYSAQANPVIGAITAVDRRDETDPTWIGAVRGGYGNPLKVLHTPRPLTDMVADSFRQALTARGLIASAGAGSRDVSITIIKFQCSQYVRREADVDIVIDVRDHASGRPVYRDEVSANPVNGSIFALDVGAFGSTDDLQAVAQAAMNQTIDAVLNKSAFLAAMQAATAPTS